MKFVGIDLHTNCFTCCILDVASHKKMVTFPINDKGIKDFYTVVDKKSIIIIEATCNSFAFAQLIKPFVKDVIVANTFELKSISFTDKKTDKVDALKLARILKSQVLSGEEQIHPVVIPPKHIQDMRALFTTYRLERKQVVCIKNRIHSLLKQNLHPFTKEYIFGKKTRPLIRELVKDHTLLYFQINLLFDQLEQIEATIVILKKKIKESASRYLKEIDILISMRGISVFTAIAIITDIIDVKRFPNSKKFASYLRSTPGISSSNEKTIIKSTSKAGRKQSIVLISQALNHFRNSNLKLQHWHSRLCEYKKPGVIRMGLCRRVITEIYQMLKKNEYHYYRDEINHIKKRGEYILFLDQIGVKYEKYFDQSA